jgi:hypothetical protein
MLNREQRITLLMLNNRRWEENNPIGWLPREIAELIMDIGYDQDPNSEIATALSLAASGQEEDLVVLAEMVKANPRLLLQAGDVVTRGGFFAERKTLYAFFLGEGDPVGAKRIEFGFAGIPDGEKMRICQYEEYRPHIEALAKQIKLKIPAYDLTSLFEMIIKSPLSHVKAMLNKDTNHKSDLSDMFCQFWDAIKLKRKGVGMHYEHYTTLIQAFELRYERWEELSNNYTNYDKCELVWRYVIGRLQLNLPAVDRFGFARAFDDEERTVNYKYSAGSFPDASPQVDFVLSGVGSDIAIFGAGVRTASRGRRRGGAVAWRWKTHVEQKLQICRTYATRAEESVSVVCNVLK